MTATVKRRIVRAGGWGLAKRLIKPIPIIGSIFALGLAGYEIKKKGLLPGAVHVGLDITPVVGTAKNVIEIFTGDWIPDKPSKNGAATNTPQLATNAPQLATNNPATKNCGKLSFRFKQNCSEVLDSVE